MNPEPSEPEEGKSPPPSVSAKYAEYLKKYEGMVIEVKHAESRQRRMFQMVIALSTGIGVGVASNSLYDLVSHNFHLVGGFIAAHSELLIRMVTTLLSLITGCFAGYSFSHKRTNRK